VDDIVEAVRQRLELAGDLRFPDRVTGRGVLAFWGLSAVVVAVLIVRVRYGVSDGVEFAAILIPVLLFTVGAMLTVLWLIDRRGSHPKRDRAQPWW